MKEKVLEIIADYKGVKPETLNLEATWAEQRLDSLDVTELVMRLEEELDVEIELAPEITNINALIAYIEARKQ